MLTVLASSNSSSAEHRLALTGFRNTQQSTQRKWASFAGHENGVLDSVLTHFSDSVLTHFSDSVCVVVSVQCLPVHLIGSTAAASVVQSVIEERASTDMQRSRGGAAIESICSLRLMHKKWKVALFSC